MIRTLALAATFALIAPFAFAEGAPSPLTQAVQATPPAQAPPAQPGAAPTIFPWAEMNFQTTDVGARIQLMDEPSRTLEVLEIHITTLNPGMSSHAPHQHANEEVIVLHEGELEVYVNGETKRIGPGSVMVFLSNDWHSVNNVGAAPATYHVINFHPGAHH
jgi:quercetin dioxygenase-like cupin family protein